VDSVTETDAAPFSRPETEESIEIGTERVKAGAWVLIATEYPPRETAGSAGMNKTAAGRATRNSVAPFNRPEIDESIERTAERIEA
jgi:hypothetical protein